jgi:hypothetical protein
MGLHSNTVKINFTEASEQLTARITGSPFKMLTETELIILNLDIWNVNYCKEIMMMLMTTTMIIEFAFRNYRRRQSYLQDKGLYGKQYKCT